jgi:hypothetical protein
MTASKGLDRASVLTLAAFIQDEERNEKTLRHLSDCAEDAARSEERQMLRLLIQKFDAKDVPEQESVAKMYRLVKERAMFFQALSELIDPIYGDKYLDWCDEHHDELLKHPNSFIAISMKERVVIAESNQEVFCNKLRELREGRVDELFVIHTSAVV